VVVDRSSVLVVVIIISPSGWAAVFCSGLVWCQEFGGAQNSGDIVAKFRVVVATISPAHVPDDLGHIDMPVMADLSNDAMADSQFVVVDKALRCGMDRVVHRW